MKFSGKVGFSTSKEVALDVWEDVVEEKPMRGDVLKSYAYYPNVTAMHETTNLGHRISLIGNEYLLKQYMQMKYVVMDGTYWEVSTVEIQRPRVIATLGGIYNGPKTN